MTAQQIISLKAYDVLRCPLVTEKATQGLENNQYFFVVDVSATKSHIKKSIESLYGVKVISVNTLNVQGKRKKFRGRMGKRKDIKKAIVRIAQGQTIDLGAGL